MGKFSTCTKYICSSLNGKLHRLKESLFVYAEEKEWKIPFGFTSRFPEGIKLSQCAAAWAVLALQEHNISTSNVS